MSDNENKITEEILVNEEDINAESEDVYESKATVNNADETDDEINAVSQQPDEESDELSDDEFEDDESDEIYPEDGESPEHPGEDLPEDDDYDESSFEDVGEKTPKTKYEQNGIMYMIAVALLKIHNTDRKRLIKNISIWGSILLIIILILTDIIPILPNSYHRSYVGNKYTLGETRNCDYDKFGNNVLYIGGGAMCVFGPDMNLEYRKEIHTGIPVVSTNSDNAIVYFKNSGEYVVVHGGDVKDYSLDENICSAYISAKGYYAIATNTVAGHNASVKVYSVDGKSIYEWYTNYNVLDCVVSQSGNYMAASVLEMEENSAVGKLVFFDLSKSEPISEIPLDDEIVFELYSTDNDKIIAIGETKTIAYTLTSKKIWQVDYNDKNLKTYDISDDGMLALVFDRYNSSQSESLLEVYDFSGRLNGTYISDKNIRRVSVNNSHSLLTIEGGTILLNNRCRPKEIKNINMNFDRAILYENYNFGFVIHDGVSEIISVCH